LGNGIPGQKWKSGRLARGLAGRQARRIQGAWIRLGRERPPGSRARFRRFLNGFKRRDACRVFRAVEALLARGHVAGFEAGQWVVRGFKTGLSDTPPRL
jgi:hypothetical protein